MLLLGVASSVVLLVPRGWLSLVLLVWWLLVVRAAVLELVRSLVWTLFFLLVLVLVHALCVAINAFDLVVEEAFCLFLYFYGVQDLVTFLIFWGRCGLEGYCSENSNHSSLFNLITS